MKVLQLRTKTSADELQERMDRIKLMLDRINETMRLLRGPERDELGSIIEFPTETAE